MPTEITAQVKALRAKLDHPVIDGDGHLIEPAPLFHKYLQQVGGTALVDSYRRELSEHPTGSRGNRDDGDMSGAWWGTRDNAHELATGMDPRPLHHSLS